MATQEQVNDAKISALAALTKILDVGLELVTILRDELKADPGLARNFEKGGRS